MRRSRIRLWMLMLVVVVTALALAPVLLIQRQRSYLAAAQMFASNEQNWVVHENIVLSQIQAMVKQEKLAAELREIAAREKAAPRESRVYFTLPQGDFEFSPETARWLHEQWKSTQETERQLRETSVKLAQARAEWADAAAKQAKAGLVSARLSLESAKRKVQYFQRMRRKYEQAAQYPWLAVEPDAPEPPTPP